MTKNKRVLKNGQSGLGSKEDKTGGMGEGFGRTLTPDELSWCQCHAHKVLPQAFIHVLQKPKQIRNTVKVDWQDGTSLSVLASF